MTKEEAIKELRDASDSEVRYGDKDNHYDKVMKRVEAFDMAIKALEQEPVLDKMRAEIEELDIYYDNDYFSTNNCPMYKCNEVLLIIDKYKAESEANTDEN